MHVDWENNLQGIFRGGGAFCKILLYRICIKETIRNKIVNIVLIYG